MTETPKRIYLDQDIEAGDGMFPRCFENPKYCNEPAIEYHHHDLSADLVRAALEMVAGIADKQREYARSNNCKTEAVGAFWTAKSLRTLASDPEAINAIVTQVMEKEHE